MKVAGEFSEIQNPPSKFWENLTFRLERNAVALTTDNEMILKKYIHITSEDQIKLAILREFTDESVSTVRFNEFIRKLTIGMDQLFDKYGPWFWRYYDSDDKEYRDYERKYLGYNSKYKEDVDIQTPIYLAREEWDRYKGTLEELRTVSTHTVQRMDSIASHATEYDWLYERDPLVATASLIVEVGREKLLVMLSKVELSILSKLTYEVDGFLDQRMGYFSNFDEVPFRNNILELLGKVR